MSVLDALIYDVARSYLSRVSLNYGAFRNVDRCTRQENSGEKCHRDGRLTAN